MKIVVIFAGLMLQVNQPWSFVNTAVLPNAMNTHTAALVIPAAMIVNEGEAESLGTVLNEHLVVPLEGARVTVEGTRGYKTVKTPAYVAAVPKLSRVAPGCDGPRRPVRDRTPDPQIATFVDYRGGSFSPDTYLANQLSFADSDWQNRCAVCGVAWTADLKGDTATLVVKRAGVEKKIVVRGSADGQNKVLIRNRPNQRTDGHFVHIYDLFDRCAQKAIPGETQKCETSTCDADTYNWERQPDGPDEDRKTWPASDCTIPDFP